MKELAALALLLVAFHSSSSSAAEPAKRASEKFEINQAYRDTRGGIFLRFASQERDSLSPIYRNREFYCSANNCYQLHDYAPALGDFASDMRFESADGVYGQISAEEGSNSAELVCSGEKYKLESIPRTDLDKLTQSIRTAKTRLEYLPDVRVTIDAFKVGDDFIYLDDSKFDPGHAINMTFMFGKPGAMKEMTIKNYTLASDGSKTIELEDGRTLVIPSKQTRKPVRFAGGFPQIVTKPELAAMTPKKTSIDVTVDSSPCRRTIETAPGSAAKPTKARR
jgi:hypothetical protein